MKLIEWPRQKDALFLFPTPGLGGAETVTRLLMEEALQSSRYKKVIGLVFSGREEHAFEDLKAHADFELKYLDAQSDLQSLWRFIHYIRNKKYSFVFSSHTHFNAMCSLLRSFRILKTDILVSRESTQIFDRVMGLRGRLAKFLYLFYGAQDVIVCQTDSMAKSLAHNTNLRFVNLTVTIPNPVSAKNSTLDKAQKRAGWRNQGAISIVWCGRLIEVKKPLVAIEVVSSLRAAGIDVELIMIGDGPLKSIIERRSSELGLTSWVSLVGQQKTPRTFFDKCDIGLITSSSEGFPNVLLEMMASGMKHIVCTPCAGGLSELPNISLAKSFEATELARLVETAVRERKDDNLVYLKHAESRTPTVYFNRLLAHASKGINIKP